MLTDPLTRETVFAEVRSQLVRILADSPGEQHRITITEDVTFSDLRVTSLQLAELVSNLESSFEVDPFAERVPITSIRNVRDLCDAYLSCLSPGSGGDDSLDAELRAVRTRTLRG